MDDNNSPESLQEIESQINYLYNPSQSLTDINRANSYLTSFIKVDNFPQLKALLSNASNVTIKIYAAQSLIELITQFYLSIPTKDIEEIYSSILSYVPSSKCLLNVLVKLLCRIVRVNWFHSSNIKNIYQDVISSTKEDLISSLMMPFPIFTELICQFQTFDLPPKHKLKKIIIDFKESALLPIFDYSIQELCALLQHEIKTEKIDDMFLFIDEVIKCLLECLEYEEDLNAKEDYYSKYEIKPVYIPNNKKRCRDKTLDIDLIESLVQSLFDTHNLMIKASSKCNTEQCLLLLQKLIAMKVIYLGDKRHHLLKICQDGICNILFNKNGMVHHEQLCKLIYATRKNYTINDLVINENYLNYLCAFTQETLRDHFIEGINGFIYLLRFFSYLSFGIERVPYTIKSTIKGFVVSLLTTVITKIKELVDCDEVELNDLIKSFGMCGYCSYETIIQLINDNINLNQDILINSILIQYGVSLMKAKYLLFTDAKMINKSTETDTMIESIHLTEFIPTDVSNTVGFILNGFSLIKLYNAKPVNNYSLNIGVLSFIKFFAKYFLSQHLPNKFLYIYQQIAQQLNLTITGEIITMLIDSLIYFCQQGSIEQRKTIKIIQIIESNCSVDNDKSNNLCKVQIGKISLTPEFVPHIQQLINIVIAINPVEKSKTRKLLLSSLFNLYSMVISYEMALNQFLSQFNFDKILNANNELLFTINSLSALIPVVKKRQEYEIFIEKIVPLIDLLACCFIKQTEPNLIMLHILKLLKHLTFNSYSRISFKTNSDCPYKLFKLSTELLNHYYSIAKKIVINTTKERYLYQITPISLFSKIFNNIFNGEFIQISVIVNAEPGSIRDLFKNLIELFTSIKHEDIFGYLQKLKSIYRMIKVIYCDYAKCSEVNEGIIENILILFHEGIDTNDKLIADSIYGAIFEWGQSYFQLYNMNTKPFMDHITLPNKDLIQVIFEKNSIQMNNLLLKMFKILLNNEFEFLESMSRAILVLGLIYNDYYNKMSIGLIEASQLTPSEKNLINDAFTTLYTRVNSDKTTKILVEMFYDDLREFCQRIKDVCDNHFNTN